MEDTQEIKKVTGGTEKAIEREYAKGPGNMNLPDCSNVAQTLYEEALKKNPNLSEESKKKLRTECALATDVEEMSQLVDRLSTDSFQG